MDVTIIRDKQGKNIRLSQERWSHIRIEHPEIADIGELEEVIKNPTAVMESDRDPAVKWLFKYHKKRKEYLKVAIKYLNGEGFIITAHYTVKIQ